MTPAIALLKKQNVNFVVHKYSHDPKTESYGDEAAEVLNLNPKQVFKTLVAQLDNDELVVAIVPTSGTLNLKLLAQAAGVKKSKMAVPGKVERSTGYVLGGVSPLAQRKALRTFIDQSSLQFDTIFVSAGRRGLEVELSPDDLISLTKATCFLN